MSKEQLKKVLMKTTITFAVTMVGHIIVYLCNKERVDDENPEVD